MAIAKEHLEERLYALRRQKLLHTYRCSKCPYRPNGRSGQVYSDDCHRCPVKYDLLDIGSILNMTLEPKLTVEEEWK